MTSAEGLRISGSLSVEREMGLGCAQLGDLFRTLSDDEAHDVVIAAWDQGIRYSDTAPHYGLGLSEQRLGAALTGRPRGEYIVSTKVGRLIRPCVGRHTDLRKHHSDRYERVWGFSRDGVLWSLEESLERLGLDRMDVLLMHDVGDRYSEALTRRPFVTRCLPSSRCARRA